MTDHRIGLTLHKLDAVLEGTALDELIDALVTEHQATALAAMKEDATCLMQPASRPRRRWAPPAAATARPAARGVDDAGNDARRLLAAVLRLVGAQTCAPGAA